jgi:nudix-type nucleoside diphosphatase (YffH/AdpP family)
MTPLIEAPAGLLDESSPEESIRKEAMEETGYVVHHVTKIFEAFMSPGSVTEKLYFFVAEYETETKRETSGGLVCEGEDIVALELGSNDRSDILP